MVMFIFPGNIRYNLESRVAKDIAGHGSLMGYDCDISIMSRILPGAEYLARKVISLILTGKKEMNKSYNSHLTLHCKKH